MDSVVEDVSVTVVSDIVGTFFSVNVGYWLKTDSDTLKFLSISPHSFIAPILISC